MRSEAKAGGSSAQMTYACPRRLPGVRPVLARRMTRRDPQPVDARIPPGHPFAGIIADAYLVFDYPRPATTGVCQNCCMSPEIEAAFFTPQIASLPLRYVQDWYSAACDPAGVPKETWAYLLPRILEVLAADEDATTFGKEVTLKRFETGNPANWTAREWDVLDRFRRAYLDREIAREGEFLDDTLCMFRLGGWPLQDLIDQVAVAPDAVLARRFWHDWFANRAPGRESIRITAFWEMPDNTTVWEFYSSRHLCDRIEDLAVAEDTDPALAEKALAVAALVEMCGDWRRTPT